jgi:hypothetical protein
MSSDKFIGRSSVLHLGGSVLILKRYKRNGREETSELVAIDVDTLEVLQTFTDKDAMQVFLEDREWAEKVAARESKKTTKATSKSSIAAALDDEDDDDVEADETRQFGQQPPV